MLSRDHVDKAMYAIYYVLHVASCTFTSLAAVYTLGYRNFRANAPDKFQGGNVLPEIGKVNVVVRQRD